MSIFSPQSGRSSKRPSSRANPQAGFTLIELMVVMSIMVVVSALLLVRQSTFDSSTLLRSLAYSVALSVRQAQVYGSSVLGTTTTQASCGGGFYSGTTCYAPAYGVYINSGTPSTYSIFADIDNSGIYTSGEDIKFFTLGQGYVISNFCATEAASSLVDCWGTNPGSSVVHITNLSIVFKRPNPDACFSTLQEPSVCKAGASPFYSSAYIQINATGGGSTATRSVYISTTGEISVQAPGT